jgi:hypothetical protein
MRITAGRIAQKLIIGLQGLVLAAGVTSAAAAGVVVSASPALAACSNTATTIADGASCSKGTSQVSNLFGPTGVFKIIANTMIFIVGGVSVIYIIIGGFRYVTSSGDSKTVTAAKDTILYAVIGVAVAIVSYALVNFVILALNKAS